MKLHRTLILLGCAAPFLSAANKDMIELQRDVTMLQDQVRQLNDKIIALTTMLQQALDNTRQSNISIQAMQDRFSDSLKKQQEGVVAPVLGVGSKLDQMSEDFRGMRETVLDMNTRIGKLDQRVLDLQNLMNVIKTAPPPPSNPQDQNSSPGASGQMTASLGGTTVPPPGMQAESTYTNAYRDYLANNYDLAIQEFTAYLKYFPTTQFAPNAQYYIGDIYYKRKEYDNAVQAFDAVLEHFSDNTKTPDAHLMKGMSLKEAGKRDAAAREFKEVITRYPDTDAAAKARTLLKQLGLNSPSTPAKKRR